MQNRRDDRDGDDYSDDRRTTGRPPFNALRLLTYSSGRCQRSGTFNPWKFAMLPINDVN